MRSSTGTAAIGSAKLRFAGFDEARAEVERGEPLEEIVWIALMHHNQSAPTQIETEARNLV